MDLASSMEEMPSKWRVTVYLGEEWQKELERWAADENRSVSNLAATLLIEALKDKRQKDKDQAQE